MRIGIFGTFAVDNFGDVLLPIIARHELGSRLSCAEIVPYSYGDKEMPHWPYAVRSLAGLDSELGDLDAIVVGGGHLVRFYKEIAADCRPTSDSIAHPTGYWLAPVLAGISRRIPVAWNAPSACREIAEFGRPLLAMAAYGSTYVSVRDDESAGVLEDVGYKGRVRVVPDTAFGLSGAIARCSPEQAAAIRRRLGITGPYLVVQATESVLPLGEAISETPEASGHTLIAVPIGPALGDDAAIVTERHPNARAFNPWPDVESLASLIAHSDGVTGVSLHLTITAIAYGVPVLRAARRAAGGQVLGASRRSASQAIAARRPHRARWLRLGARFGGGRAVRHRCSEPPRRPPGRGRRCDRR